MAHLRSSSLLPLTALLALLTACPAATPTGGDLGDPGNSDAGAGDAGPPPGDGSSGGGDGGNVTPVIPAAHPRIYLNQTQRARLNAALAAKTPAAMRFKDMVDRQLTGTNHYNFQAWFAALLYPLTGDVKYATYAIGRVDAWVTAEEARIAAGTRADVAADSYLYVGDHVGDLALTYDWCYDRLTPSQKQRWAAYADQAVWNVWNHQQAKWGNNSFPWSGWSVNNPSNNYYYSFLRATMLLGVATRGDLGRADEWIAKFRSEKIQKQLVPAFASDLGGGGSREGTGYGVAMASLFHLYDLWGETTGERIADLTPHARASLSWMSHAIVPTLDRVAPHGDHARDSTGALFDYHRNYLQTLAGLYPGDATAQASRTLLAGSSVPRMSQYFMYVFDFLYDGSGQPTQPLDRLYPTYFGAGTGQLFARSAWTPTATYLTFTAGPYTESHAHHDQGSFVVYANEWLAYDANIDSHSGIQQGETNHNLVRVEVGGMIVPQREGAPPSQLLALHDDERITHVAADTRPIYDGAASITEMQREIVFLKPGVVVVFDRVTTSGGNVRKVWQLNTPIQPALPSASRVTLQGTKGRLDLFQILPATTNRTVVSLPATDADYNAGHRVEIADATAGRTLFLHVLATGNAATAATLAPAMSNTSGVTITLPDGTATVRFNDAGVGGTVEVRNGSNVVTYTRTLAAGVATLPLTK